MKRFEYTDRLIAGNKWQEACTTLGAEGWEWLSQSWCHLDDRGRLLDSWIVYFKREIAEDARPTAAAAHSTEVGDEPA